MHNHIEEANVSRQSYNSGKSQSSRKNSVLPSEYFLVNELNQEDYLSLTTHLSEKVTFFDTHDISKNATHKNWSTFFTSDETFILATIMKYDLDKTEKEFQTLFSGQFDPKDLLVAFNGTLIREIDCWLRQLSLCNGEFSSKLSIMLTEVIRKKLTLEFAIFSVLAAKWSIPINTWNLNQIWTDNSEKSLYGSQMISMVASLDTSGCNGIIRSNFLSILTVCKQCREVAATYFQSTWETQKHSPNSSLFLSFVSQLEETQKSLNKFTENLGNFYYNKVLQFASRPAKADKTVVTINCGTFPQESITIPKGTLFTGSIENQQDELIFQSVKESRLVNAEITQIITLSCSKDHDVKPESEADFITHLRLNSIPESCINSSDQNWALFGHKESPGVETLKSPPMGFALSSPSFLLREGNREITVIITCTDDSWNSIIQSISTFASHEQLPETEMFYRIFDTIFKVSISTETGWYALSEITVHSSLTHNTDEPNQLRFHLSIPAGIPALSACDKAVHGNCFSGNWPVLQFQMNYENHLFPYSLLKMITVKRIDIAVAAQGVKRLKLFNESTPLDPQTTILPFGAIPSKGSSFLFGSYEMLFKNITDVSISLEWANTPLEIRGFEEYYQEYSNSFSNSCFKATLSELHNGYWHPTVHDEEIVVELFENKLIHENGYEYESEQVSSDRKMNHLAIPEIGKATTYISENEYTYSISARGGFYRMTLTEPESAFGHKAYSNEIMSTLMKNAKSKLADQRKIPNLPYTPSLKSISLDYTAHETVDLTLSAKNETGTSFYHITPLGKNTIHEKESFPLIVHLNDKEDIDYAGNCFIAITPATISGEITLYFNLHNDSLGSSNDDDTPVTEWSYLENNHWKKIHSDMIIEDSTMNFQTDGIVTLVIPKHDNSKNTLLDNSSLWLRISSNISPEKSCSVTDVKLNGVPVIRDMTQSNSNSYPLPAGTITKLHKAVPGIQNIEQLSPTTHGKKKETPPEMQLRMRERLIHKNRAVLPQDYELLILDKFPEIVQAKCFSNLSLKRFKSERDFTHPGNILCVVIPNPKDYSSVQYNRKMYVNTPDLKEIHAYITACSSPFSTIELANPVYEQIQVRCAVSFSNTKDNGLYKKQLNEDISRYISPWYIEGKEISFGWRIRSFEMVNYIKNLDYVRAVTDFSMLHITDTNDHKYHLFDTTLPDHEQKEELFYDASTKDEIIPLFPWSLPIPMETHFIQVLDHVEEIAPEHVGIKEISIGKTFIIQDD